MRAIMPQADGNGARSSLGYERFLLGDDLPSKLVFKVSKALVANPSIAIESRVAFMQDL